MPWSRMNLLAPPTISYINSNSAPMSSPSLSAVGSNLLTVPKYARGLTGEGIDVMKFVSEPALNEVSTPLLSESTHCATI
jgi:hypothetical protein